jgi:hypothetical protein
MKKLLRYGVASLLLCSGTVVQAQDVYVACPLDQIRTEVTTRLPDGWWSTPQVGRVTEVRVQDIGGRPTLVCAYQAFGAAAAVMREFPPGAQACRPRGQGFVCSMSGAVGGGAVAGGGSPAGGRGALREDCLRFNPQTTEVRQIQGRWKIVDGNHWMFDFGGNGGEASRALGIIRYYRMNEVCFVGRPNPPLTYLLVSGQPPSGAMSGEDCVGFDPGSAVVRNAQGRWKIDDRGHWVFDFGSKRAEAQQALDIIRHYGFARSCYVGRPNPSFEYLRR